MSYKFIVLYLIVYLFSLCFIQSIDALDNDPRIVNGLEVKLKQFPFVVHILIVKDKFKSGCTGSILTERWVLTAAHCYAKTYIGPKDSTIVAGTIDSAISTPHTQSRKSYHLVRYAKYFKPDKDVALLKVRTPFEFNEYVGSILLIKEPFLENKAMECLAMGFGRTNIFGDEPKRPTRLYYMHTEAGVGDKFCNKTIRCGKECVCTNNKNNNSACFGDSGGPLVCDGRLAGVLHGRRDVPMFVPCLTQKGTQVYMSTLHFESWIRKYVKDLKTDDDEEDYDYDYFRGETEAVPDVTTLSSANQCVCVRGRIKLILVVSLVSLLLTICISGY